MIHNDRVLQKLITDQNAKRPLLVGDKPQQELNLSEAEILLREDRISQVGPHCDEVKTELETAHKAYLDTEPEWSEIIFRREVAPCFGDGRYLCSMRDDHNDPIQVKDRYGILDFKLHEVDKHVHTPRQWITWALAALQSVYGYAENGTDVFLSRANLLQDFIDHYRNRYHSMMDTQSVLDAAKIISWNVFQPDGESSMKIMDWNSIETVSLSKVLSLGGVYA